MASLLSSEFFPRNLTWSGPAPVEYSAHFSLNRIMPGVDNFHYDVHLSPVFRESVSRIIFHLILKSSRADEDLDIDYDWLRERREFKRLCRDIMLDAVKRAKMGDGEIQIDYLAQITVCKFLLQEVAHQFEELMTRLNNQVWEYESTNDNEMVLQTLSLKERVLAIRHKRNSIVSEVSAEIFSYLLEAQEPLQERREANYGTDSLLKEDIFVNPLLHIEDQYDDYFMLEQYVLLGHRIDDPDRYEILLQVISDLLGRIKIAQEKETEKGEEAVATDSEKKNPASDVEMINPKIVGWIREIGNVDLLLNYFRTIEEIREMKNKINHDKIELRRLETLAKDQKRIFNAFYDRFRQKKLISRIIAGFEMKPVYQEYCPPLAPQQVLQYFISGEARKSVTAHLKRLKVYYGKSVSLVSLKKAMMKMGRLKDQQRNEYLLQFLRGFFRYHRDLENFKLLKQALDRVNLVVDEKTIALSKTNHTLYEFLLQHEQVFELDTKPVTSHVIMKADVRGATIITRQLDEKGLNPASYFSLNFFNPISEIVSQYGALKVFIEGDAIILAILERKDDEAGKYCVSRACGLALNMLNVIQKYNGKSKKYNLPILELGVGICYQNAPPAYLLDGKKRIMISPAINLADRLSSCDKTLRRVFAERHKAFNLYVYQLNSDEAQTLSDDEVILRYNVNGIELNETGFKKLASEIDLKTINCLLPEVQKDPIVIHTGKFPLVTGTFQRLILREDWVQELNPADLEILGKVNRKYYEICTQEALKQYVENQEKETLFF
jgi:class 3 adenylate cyclase